MHTDFDDNYLHKISSKQTTFIVLTNIMLWVCIALAFVGVFFFVTTYNYNKNERNAINKYNHSSAELFNYFKTHNNRITTECYDFDGHRFLITAPMVLSTNAKQKLQFETGLKLPGMTITPTEIDLSGTILFNNNLYTTYEFESNAKSLIQASMNSHFIGKPGYTEIGFKLNGQNSQCNPFSSVGANNNPFPGVYVTAGSSPNSFNLCLCLTNWVRRNNTDTATSPLQLALQGNGAYNTPGEYCIPLS